MCRTKSFPAPELGTSACLLSAANIDLTYDRMPFFLRYILNDIPVISLEKNAEITN